MGATSQDDLRAAVAGKVVSEVSAPSDGELELILVGERDGVAEVVALRLRARVTWEVRNA